MTLTTHAVAGAFIGAVAYQHPVLAVCAAVLSHPLLDTIPHWDYPILSGKMNDAEPLKNNMNTRSKSFVIDLMRIGLDFWLGLIIVIAAFYSRVSSYIFLIMFLCALAAIAPDPLQFVYWKTKSKILEPWQRFHVFMHAKKKLNDHPVLGVLSQAAIIIIILICTYAVI